MKVKTFFVMTFSVGVTLSLGLGLNLGLLEIRFGSFSLTRRDAGTPPTWTQQPPQAPQDCERDPIAPLQEPACRRLDQSLGRWVTQAGRKAQTVACAEQRGSWQRLRRQAVVLRRSVQRIGAVIAQQRQQMQTARTALEGRCAACLSRDECGSCPIEGAKLRKRCEAQRQNLRQRRKQLRTLGVECGSARQRFQRLRAQAKRLGRARPTKAVLASDTW